MLALFITCACAGEPRASFHKGFAFDIKMHEFYLKRWDEKIDFQLFANSY